MSPCLGTSDRQTGGTFRLLGQSRGGRYGAWWPLAPLLMPRPEAETEMFF